MPTWGIWGRDKSNRETWGLDMPTCGTWGRDMSNRGTLDRDTINRGTSKWGPGHAQQGNIIAGPRTCPTAKDGAWDISDQENMRPGKSLNGEARAQGYVDQGNMMTGHVRAGKRGAWDISH